MYTGVYAFIAGVIIVGVSIGFYVQGMLIETHQDVKLPAIHGAELA
jgi:hypothetical protein